MCGFAGFVDGAGMAEGRRESIIREMALSIERRGPDDEGFWSHDESGLHLGFRRLAILDLSDRVNVVVNGMVPNVVGIASYLSVLDQALAELKDLDEEQYQVVELRLMAAMSTEEIALVTGMSQRNVQRRWRGARAWLRSRLAESGA